MSRTADRRCGAGHLPGDKSRRVIMLLDKSIKDIELLGFERIHATGRSVEQGSTRSIWWREIRVRREKIGPLLASLTRSTCKRARNNPSSFIDNHTWRTSCGAEILWAWKWELRVSVHFWVSVWSSRVLCAMALLIMRCFCETLDWSYEGIARGSLTSSSGWCSLGLCSPRSALRVHSLLAVLRFV
jgi:hypothetical protein